MLESTSRYHFLALFVTAGIVSSLVSHCYTLLYVLPRALRSPTARSAIAPSHGASGSIYATIVITGLGVLESATA
jgi:rhomboid-like protein